MVAAVAAALLAASAARAECKLTTIEVPVAMHGLRPIVEAKIAGEPVDLLLDSGAFFSRLGGGVVDKLKLKVVPVNKTGSLIPEGAGTYTSGVAGRVGMTGIVTAPTFDFAGSSFTQVQFLTSGDVSETGGLLGQNVLHAMDDDFDLKKGVFRLVKPVGCEAANLAFWVQPGSSYSVVPLEHVSRENPHTTAMIEINGVQMRAQLDTGAATSFITERAAARAGVKTTDPGVEPAGDAHGTDRVAVKTWVARFADIKIGAEEIKNGKLSIGATRADSFDVLLGADFFLAHHVYVANSQGKVYFTYEGGPVFRAAERVTAASE